MSAGDTTADWSAAGGAGGPRQAQPAQGHQGIPRVQGPEVRQCSAFWLDPRTLLNPETYSQQTLRTDLK